MRTSHRYLDPTALSRLGGMELVARLVVEGFITGRHKSPYQGFSVEFAEHRQYMPGDAIRDIDWKVYGKSDRYYIKKFEEETNLRAYILLDASGSMNYKYDDNGITKFEYACYLAASLTYLMLKPGGTLRGWRCLTRISGNISRRAVPQPIYTLSCPP